MRHYYIHRWTPIKHIAVHDYGPEAEWRRTHMSGRRVELLRGSVFLRNPSTGGTGFGPTRDINGIRRVSDYHKRSLRLRIYSDKTCAHYVDTNRETVASKAPGQSQRRTSENTSLLRSTRPRTRQPPATAFIPPPLPPQHTHTHTHGRALAWNSGTRCIHTLRYCVLAVSRRRCKIRDVPLRAVTIIILFRRSRALRD